MSTTDDDLDEVAIWAAEVGETSAWEATGYAARDAGEMPVVVAGKAPAERTPAILSSDVQARDGDIIKQNWKLREFLQNPVVLAEHDTRRVVGRGEGVRVEQTAKGPRLRGDTVWDIDSEQGRELARKYEVRMMHAFSVRWVPTKLTERSTLKADDPYYKALEERESPWGGKYVVRSYVHEAPVLLEWSSVAIPGDANALAIRTQRAMGPRPVDPRAAIASAANPGAVLAAEAGATRAWLEGLRACVAGDAQALDELAHILALGLRSTGDTPGAKLLRRTLDAMQGAQHAPAAPPLATQIIEAFNLARSSS